MGDYFKPLRRKIGVVTLVIACVCAACWVRSLTVVDSLVFCRCRPIEERFLSWNGSLVWMRDGNLNSYHFDPYDEYQQNLLEWHVDELYDDTLVEPHYIVWAFRHCGFAVGFPNEKTMTSFGICMTPYWSIIIPLALFSAWLLLSKPRLKPPGPTQARTVPESHLGPQLPQEGISPYGHA